MNEIYPLRDKKKMIVASDYLAFTGESFINYSEMLKYSGKISMRNSFTIIRLKDIIQIKYNEVQKDIKINYSSPINVYDTYEVYLADKDQFENLIKEVNIKLPLIKSTKKEKGLLYLTERLFEICFGVFLCWATIGVYHLQQNGDEIIDGLHWRSRASGAIILFIVDKIGTNNFILIISVYLLWLLYKGIQRFIRPKNDITLKPEKR